jgi:hypothetical protein
MVMREGYIHMPKLGVWELHMTFGRDGGRGEGLSMKGNYVIVTQFLIKRD